MVLVEGLEAGGPALLEGDPRRFAVAAVLAPGEVVVHLVVVPDSGVGRERMECLEIRIGSIEAVLPTVLTDSEGLGLPWDGAGCLPITQVSVVSVLIDVVTKYNPVIDTLVGKVPVELIEAGLPVGARCLAEDEGVDRLARIRSGARARGLGDELAGLEPVVVLGIRRQALDVEVHAVAVLRGRLDRALLDVLGELRIGRDLVGDLLRALLAHAAVELEGLGCQAGPQDDARRGGITRGHPHTEGIGRLSRLLLAGVVSSRDAGRDHGRPRGRSAQDKEGPAVEAAR